nr:TetR/AcrR family transcriptional regulator [uncultured Blautia sp.]
MIQTKDTLKDTFWDILEEKPYNRITVQDIVNRCCVNRNTFYYHFQDIPTLMIDSIEDWMEEVIQNYGTFTSPVDCLTYMAEECMKRKRAFLHLFRSVQKDTFLAGLNKMGYDIIQKYVNKIGEYKKISQKEKELFIKCYKCVFVGSLLDWMEEGASYDLKEFYEELCKMFAGSGERVVSGYESQ